MSFVSTESNEESKNFTSSHTEKSNYVAFDKSRDYDESVIVESIQSHHKDKFQENNGNSDTQNEELDTIVENQSNDYERKPPEESKSIVISEQLTTNNEKIKIKSRYNDSAKRKIIQKLNKNKQTEVYDSKNNNKQINITARENNDNVKYKNGLIKITENESKVIQSISLIILKSYYINFLSIEIERLNSSNFKF